MEAEILTPAIKKKKRRPPGILKMKAYSSYTPRLSSVPVLVEAIHITATHKSNDEFREKYRTDGTPIILHIPDGHRWVVDYAFQNCTALTEVHFPASLTSIGKSAFEKCTGLTEVRFPASLTRIEDYAFYLCTALTDVYCLGNLLSRFDYRLVFSNQDITLHIPATITSWSGDQCELELRVNNEFDPVAQVTEECDFEGNFELSATVGEEQLPLQYSVEDIRRGRVDLHKILLSYKGKRRPPGILSAKFSF